jgi:tetratricopeptide (TPR) repeat protein
MVQRNPLSTDASLRREFLEKAREVLEEQPEPRRMLAHEWLAECERAPRAECSMAAERHIDWLQRNAPDVPDTALLQARRTAAEGNFAEADRLLQAACHSQQDPVPCLRLRARFAAKVGPEALEKVAKALVAHESGNDELCATSHEYLGQLFNEIGAPGSALTHFNAAADRLPTATRWAQVAAAAQRAGETTLAASAYERAARLDPTGGYAGKAAQLRGTLPAGSASLP